MAGIFSNYLRRFVIPDTIENEIQIILRIIRIILIIFTFILFIWGVNGNYSVNINIICLFEIY